MLKELEDTKNVQRYQVINLIDVIAENGDEIKVEDPRDNRIVIEIEIDEELSKAKEVVTRLQSMKDDITAFKAAKGE